MIAAAREGDVERVRAILDADPAAVHDRQGRTTKGEYANEGRTALHWAAGRDDLPLARLLLSRGADPNAKDQFSQRPLHLGPGTGVARALLAAGADPRARASNHDTPLHEARTAGVAALLLDRGADVRDRDDFRDTPLHDAASRGRADVVALLLARGADVHARNKVGSTPLHEGAGTRVELVGALLDRGAKADVTNDVGERPLDVAVEWGRTEIVRLLVGRGADVRRTESGYTYLHDAALHGRAETAGLLIDLGLNVNARTKAGGTPLLFAAENGRLDCVRLLLDRGADPRARDAEGRTPLSAASIEQPYLEIQGTSEDTTRHRESWRAQGEERKAVVAVLRDRGAVD